MGHAAGASPARYPEPTPRGAGERAGLDNADEYFHRGHYARSGYGGGEPGGAAQVTRTHDGTAGVYGAVLAEGTIRAGDPVEVLD